MIMKQLIDVYKRQGAMLRPSLPVSPLVTTTTHVKSVVSLAQPKLIAPLFFMKKGYSEHILKFLVLPPVSYTHLIRRGATAAKLSSSSKNPETAFCSRPVPAGRASTFPAIWCLC